MRRTSRIAVALGFSLALSALVACGPGYNFRQGAAALESGDYYTAVLQFRQACDGRRNQEEACANLAFAEQELVGQAVSNARLMMWDDNYEAAFGEIWRARELVSSPDLDIAEQEVLDEGVEHFGRELDNGNNRGAYEGASMLTGYFPRDNGASALLDESATAYAEELDLRAEEALENEQYGVALAARVARYDVISDAVIAGSIEELREELENEVLYRYRVELDGLFSDSRIPSIEGGSLARFVTSDGIVHLEVDADLSDVRYDQDYVSRYDSHSYLAGYEEVDNPEYAQAEADVDSSERNVELQEDAVERAMENLRTAEENLQGHIGQADEYYWRQQFEDAQNAYERAESDLRSARDAYQQARNRVASTPRTVQQEVWEDYRYEVRTFTREATSDLVIRLLASRNSDEIRVPIRVTTTDEWHQGNSEVGLAEDPLDFPIDDYTLRSDVIARALDEVEGALENEFLEYRDDFLANYDRVNGGDDGVIDSLVRYVLLRPTRVPDEVQAYMLEHAGLYDVERLSNAP